MQLIRKKHSNKTILASLLAASLAMTACSSGGDEQSNTKAGNDDSSSSKLEVNKKLHDALPKNVKDSGVFTVVIPGVNPPWYQEDKANDSYKGTGAEISKAMGKVLGVKIKFQPLSKISAAVASISSGHYEMAMAPYGDTSDKTGDQKRKNVKYVDIVKEIVPFLVPKGNPKDITNLYKLCGDNNIAAQVNGGAFKLLKDESKKCKQEGKKPFKVTGVDGVPNGVLSVKSGRTDALFSSGSALFYYANHSDGKLVVAGADNPNGYGNLYQGIVFPNDSKLIKPVLNAMKIVFNSGVYKDIMKKYGLERQMIDEPGIDLAAKNAKKSKD